MLILSEKVSWRGERFMVGDRPDYLKTYDQIQSRKVRWLWYPYIALGKITLLQGDPGDGKSTMKFPPLLLTFSHKVSILNTHIF